MAITKSAKKALRQSKRRKVMNDKRARAMREAVKGVRVAVASGTSTDAVPTLAAAYKAIDKAAKRGIIKKNTADRKKSRVAHSFAAKK